MTTSKRPRTAIVLSGGGVRGAYEAGIVAGIVDVLGLRPEDESPFDVYAGTSVGAINATYLAANAERGDMNADGLGDVWRKLRLNKHLRIPLADVIGRSSDIAKQMKRFVKRQPTPPPTYLGRSVLDPQPIDDLISRSIDWDQLRRNVAAGDVDALMVAALHINTGRTTVFVDQNPALGYVATDDPRRTTVCEDIEAQHVLASAAIPALFPARRVNRSYYVDGGLRFNTPLAPALRAGAERILIVTLQHEGQIVSDEQWLSGNPEGYPSATFLLGKLLNALLLDPVVYDLKVMKRFNRVMAALEKELDPEALEKVHEEFEKARGLPYRPVNVLEFAPSRNIGVMAGEFVQKNLKKFWTHPTALLLWRVARSPAMVESDLLSYVLFEGRFAEKLIELGRQDALAKAEQIREFFA